MPKPYGCRVRIIVPEDEAHYWTVDGELAAELVLKGIAEPVEQSSQAFIKLIRLRGTVEELQAHVFKIGKRRRHKPVMRAPDSSTGGGDQGLAPLIGRRITVHLLLAVEPAQRGTGVKSESRLTLALQTGANAGIP
jgi:hypothetical protein